MCPIKSFWKNNTNRWLIIVHIKNYIGRKTIIKQIICLIAAIKRYISFLNNKQLNNLEFICILYQIVDEKNRSYNLSNKFYNNFNIYEFKIIYNT